MTVLDVGNLAIDRPTNSTSNAVHIEIDNPVNANGFITAVELYIYAAGNVKVGMFVNAGNGIWYCRNVADLGYLTVGYHAIVGLNLVCQMGDYIGWSSPTARVEMTGTGGSGIALTDIANMVADTYFSPTFVANYIESLGGSGDSGSAEPNQLEVNAILDAVLESYMPAVSNWWAEHMFLRENPDYITAFLIFLLGIQSGGGPGGLTLQQLIDALDLRFTGLETILAADVTNIRDDIGEYVDPHIGLRSALDTAEGNIEAGDTANTVNILAAISAIPITTPPTKEEIAAEVNAAHPSDVSSAVSTLQGNITTAQNNVNAHTDSAVANVNGWIASAISTINAWTTAAKEAILADIAGHVAEILAAIAGLGGGNSYPGDDAVTLGTSVSFTGSVRITAAAYGVGGKMDGIRLTWTTVPQTKGKQEVQGIANWKYLGWLTFESTARWADRIQWLGLNKVAYLPDKLTSPGAVVISARDGAQGTATPFVVNS